MFSSGFGAASGCASAAGTDEAAATSSEAELSGIGAAWTGAAWGAGSLMGALSPEGGGAGGLTVVSPVNGFLYSLRGVITSREVGL